MSAFIVAEIIIKDQENYEIVKKRTPPTVAKYGGKYLARGGMTETLEGNWNPQRIVIIQFDSVETAKNWWNSEIYEPIKKMRQAYSITNMVITEGNPII